MRNYVPFIILVGLAVVAWLYYSEFLKGSKLPSTVHSITLKSKVLHRSVDIWIYLPPNYTSVSRRLPVVYMTDGQNIFHGSDSVESWKVDEALDKVFAKTKKQFIAVGIGSNPKHRMSELSPYKNVKYDSGRADLLIEFIREELLNEVESKYFASQNPKDRAFVGSSLGGLTSFYAAFNANDAFGKFGVFSPSFWFNPEVFDLVKTNALPNDVRMYFVMGDREEDEHLKLLRMDSLMKQNHGIDYHLEVTKGGEHSEKFWASQFENAIEYLYKEKKE